MSEKFPLDSPGRPQLSTRPPGSRSALDTAGLRFVIWSFFFRTVFTVKLCFEDLLGESLDSRGCPQLSRAGSGQSGAPPTVQRGWSLDLATYWFKKQLI